MIEESTMIQMLILIAGFALVAVSSNQIARQFQKIHLPLISGLMITGVLAGPYVLNLIPEIAKVQLSFISETALAYIAFAAGSELYLNEMRSKLRSIKIQSFAQTAITFLASGFLVFFLADMIPFMKELSLGDKLSVSLLTGVIFVTPSPASVIAIVNELRAKGPFTQVVLGVTIVKDFVVVVMFAIILAVAKTLAHGDSFELTSLLIIVIELIVSFGGGFLVGKGLEAALKLKIKHLVKTVLILALGYLVYLLSHHILAWSEELSGHGLYLEPLLICLVGSFYVANYSNYRPEFLKILHEVGTPVYVAFFTLTGASMDLPVLAEVWGIALLFFVIRLLATTVGALAGNMLAGDPHRFLKVVWMPYIAQAGVALGLATVIANQFPGWGEDFAVLIIAIIVINQLVGPPFVRWAIDLVGENKSRADVPRFDGVMDALIFGYESQSLALSRQLMEKGWKVEMITLSDQKDVEVPDGIKLHFVTQIDKKLFEGIDAKKFDAIVTLLSDEENYRICEIVYEEIGTKQVVVRLNERVNLDKFVHLGVKVIDPSTAMVSLLDHFVRSPQATSLLLGMEQGQDTRDIVIRNPDLHGLPLRSLRLPPEVIILSMRRAGQMIISHGYTRLRVGDIVTMVGSNSSLDEIELKFGN
ncbi:Potassium transporter TrkA [Imperialibacter sp. EC-SDR9]|nr:Potassium transporter TrkA [Imperialibacter sp. 89]CAD5298891.1 Potassium transporter TrkA [Imperialibacter sp. 75]VVT35092.1 Potassium transporter TrkA [Imperialibacter sp. EC-SDR9]